MTPMELSKIIGYNYYQVFKPYSKEELYASDIMQPSFWKTSETKPDTMLLSLDNIVKVFFICLTGERNFHCF